MKLVEVPHVGLGTPVLGAALQKVFGIETLRRVHGDSVKVKDFDSRGQRQFTFTVDVGCIPSAVRAFFCKRQLRIRTTQTLSKDSETCWKVSNKLKMHFLGAELFRIRPVFWLEVKNGETYLGGRVQHDAMLPPPLNGICENFMAVQSATQLAKFAEVLADKSQHSEILRKWSETHLPPGTQINH